MQKNSITTTEVNKVKIAFTKKKMTAYGGFVPLSPPSSSESALQR
jgi:hypothetical protein